MSPLLFAAPIGVYSLVLESVEGKGTTLDLSTAVTIVAAAATILVTVGAIVNAIFESGKWKNRVDSSVCAVDDLKNWRSEVDKDRSSVREILIGIQKEMKTFRQEMKTFRQELGTFRQELGTIRRNITSLFERLPSPTTKSASPISLTDLGESVAEEIDAHHWAGGAPPELEERVSGKSVYEIQEFCMNYCLEFEPEVEYLTTLQDCALDRGIDMVSVRRVLGVVLRDELLRREPNSSSV